MWNNLISNILIKDKFLQFCCSCGIVAEVGVGASIDTCGLNSSANNGRNWEEYARKSLISR